MATSLIIAGSPSVNARYTLIPMVDAQDPKASWTAYAHAGHTKYHPNGGTDEERETRAKVFAYVTGGEYQVSVKGDGFRQHKVRVAHRNWE